MSIRVLAAEDSPTQAIMLQSLLEEAGFEVALAPDGAAALALLDGRAFDVIVSDVVMPRVDGYELTRRAKRLAPRTPVMLLTSLDDPMDIVRALNSGADAFLRKPYQPADLLQRVRALLDPDVGPDHDGPGSEFTLTIDGQEHRIDAGRQQILTLLVSTFEELAALNRQLRDRERQLEEANHNVALRLSEVELERQRLRAVLGALPPPMAVVDDQATIVHANASLAALLGVDVASLIGSSSAAAISLVDHSGTPLGPAEEPIQQAIRTGRPVVRGTAFDLFLARRGGERIPAIKRAAPIADPGGAVVGAVAVIENVGSLLAYDPVTALPGHAILVDRLARSVRAAEAEGLEAGLLVVKIDRFERLRQAMPAGDTDRLLAHVAGALRDELTTERVRQRCPHASAAYLGGDELAVVLPNLEDEADAIVIAEALVAALSQVLHVEGTEVAITVSVAVGMSSAISSPDSLVRAVAGSARQASADGGRRVTSTDPLLHAEVALRLQREGELRAALRNGELVLHYQPQISLDSGGGVAVEALVRWQHPRLGLLGADQIIPLAIESGLIAPLGWEVLAQACRQLADLRRSGLPSLQDLVVSVNLAVEQLLDPDVDVVIERILRDTGIDPGSLVLEVTEASLMTHRAAAAQRLARIRALGVQIAIDDFGTGYSSLVHLRDLPVDVLKIDRTFVAGIGNQETDTAIITGTIVLARELGLEIVAEGVETGDQADALRRLGCQVGQGYHWARPMPAADLVQWWGDHGQPATLPG